MILIIKVNIKKVEGKTCDRETVFEMLDELLDGEVLYPQHPDAEEESAYEITSVTLVDGPA